MAKGPPYNNNYLDQEGAEYGFDSPAYPSYLSTIEDHDKFKLSFEKLVLTSSDDTVTTVSVDDFGAKGDGTSDDTQAFMKAWKQACNSSPEAVMVVPEEKTYHVKPIRFSGPCKANNLTVQIYGTIEASDDRLDYKKDRSLWIVFDNVDNLMVQGGGSGTINGNGNIWWQHSCKIHKSLALTFNENKNLIVENLNIQNAQQMHVSFQKCTNVLASNLTITAPKHSPNTDGIHVTNTKHIYITSSTIGTGDDCISIVSGSQNVQVEDITCGPGHGISIGSLGAGKSKATVSGVTVNGAKLSGTTNGVRIKTWQGGSGYARNIKFQNIEMSNVTNPIIVDQRYCDQDKPCKEQSSAVQVKNVVYQNIKGTSASKVAVKFDCSENYPCQGIVLEDINLQAEESEESVEASCNNVQETQIGVGPPYNNNYLDQEGAAYGFDSPAYPSYLSTIGDHDKFKLSFEKLGLTSSDDTVTTVSVDDFGAKGDGTSDDTRAFMKAWKRACHSSPGAVMVVPEEKTYRVKPIRFSGPCKAKNLTVQIYGTIEASDDRLDYKKDSSHWLVFDNVDNLMVQGGGSGTINGNGNIWWQHSCKIHKSLPCKHAPTALTFYENKNLIVENLNIQDAQQMHVSFKKCTYVLASNLTITAPEHSPNTDGIHVTNTKHIYITNSTIGTGDDCISIVSGSQNVLFEDITCGPGHGISIGSLGAGHSKATVSGVTVNGAKLNGTANGVRIKTWQSSAVQVKNVVYQNIKGTSASKVAVKFDCNENYPCQGIVLEDINLQAEESGESVEASCNNVQETEIGVVFLVLKLPEEEFSHLLSSGPSGPIDI
ncbi:hypothetical protein EZV62_005376 [Acer yangbiense]|uniref:endo-polygalacturonase n=1 Tax=Acer yangbiense TaxID=1000413 RepID=A0A5C7IMF8_9ROSI|nr:hypothetical protein EZV62_005376 [Acer yangbiense]